MSKPTYWPGEADYEETGPIGDGTPHARMHWFWDRMMEHRELIRELTGYTGFESNIRFEEAIANAFDKLATEHEASVVYLKSLIANNAADFTANEHEAYLAMEEARKAWVEALK